MKNILIISGHPDLEQSVANRTILAEVAQALPQAEIRYLDRLYPDYQIDVVQEQQALLNADVIVWQFPFSWYSLPGLMKLWLDQVFLHGFAHGSQGKLAGKKLILSFTTGAPAEVYQANGAFKHSVEDYLTPFETTALLCGLDLQTPIYTTDVSYIGREDQAGLAHQQQQAKQHAERLLKVLEG